MSRDIILYSQCQHGAILSADTHATPHPRTPVQALTTE